MQVQVHKDVKLLIVRGSGTFENKIIHPSQITYTFHSALMNAFRLFSICMTKKWLPMINFTSELSSCTAPSTFLLTGGIPIQQVALDVVIPPPLKKLMLIYMITEKRSYTFTLSKQNHPPTPQKKI